MQAFLFYWPLDKYEACGPEWTHLPRVPHICVRKLGQHWFRSWLVAWRRQPISWANTDLFSIGPSGINFIDILIDIQPFHWRKCVWKCRLRFSRQSFIPSYLGTPLLEEDRSHLAKVSTCEFCHHSFPIEFTCYWQHKVVKSGKVTWYETVKIFSFPKKHHQQILAIQNSSHFINNSSLENSLTSLLGAKEPSEIACTFLALITLQLKRRICDICYSLHSLNTWNIIFRTRRYQTFQTPTKGDIEMVRQTDRVRSQLYCGDSRRLA